MVTEPNQFFDLLYSPEFEVSDARLVNDDTVEVHYRNVGEFEEQNNKVNIVVAAFTTAYARKPEPPLGDYLGDLTDELDGDYITTFVSGGPKNYAYVTNNDKRVTKIRGITLDHATTKKLNPSVMRSLVHLHVNCHTEAKVTVDIPFKITRDKKKKKIITKRMKKDYRVVYNKRVITENYGTVPYGY